LLCNATSTPPDPRERLNLFLYKKKGGKKKNKQQQYFYKYNPSLVALPTTIPSGASA